MRLDWKLVRTILAHIEAETIENFLDDADGLADWKEGQLLSERNESRQDKSVCVVYRHIRLLEDGGFIRNMHIDESVDGYFQCALGANPDLTLSGYSLLESLRSDGFIEKLKKYAKDNAVPLTIETVKPLISVAITSFLK